MEKIVSNENIEESYVIKVHLLGSVMLGISFKFPMSWKFSPFGPCVSKNYIKIKVNLSFYFHFSLRYLQGLHKTFWGTTMKYENKNLFNFCSLSGIWTRSVNLSNIPNYCLLFYVHCLLFPLKVAKRNIFFQFSILLWVFFSGFICMIFFDCSFLSLISSCVLLITFPHVLKP